MSDTEERAQEALDDTNADQSAQQEQQDTQDQPAEERFDIVRLAPFPRPRCCFGHHAGCMSGALNAVLTRLSLAVRWQRRR